MTKFVAFVPETDSVVVQSKFLAVGSVVRWARAGVGAVATQAMARTYTAALGAGRRTGGRGDSRGKQTAALLVVREGGGYGGDNDRVVALRVDDHPDPIEELIRIQELHPLYFGETRPEDVLALDGDVRGEVADALRRSGYIRELDVGDDDLFDALSACMRTENFGKREQECGYLDRAVLEYMRGQS